MRIVSGWIVLLDGLTGLLAGVCLLIGLTGGTTFHFPSLKLEASALDPWVILLAALLLVRARLARQAGPVWDRFEGAVRWLGATRRGAKTACWALALTLFSLWLAHCARHFSIRTHAFDQVFMNQSYFHAWPGLTASLLHTRPLHCDLADGLTYLGEHVSFTMLAISPLTVALRFLPFHDQWLFLVQALLLGVPVWLAVKHGPLRDRRQLWFVAVFLVCCTRSWRNPAVWDFREDVLGFASLLLALTALSRGKIALYAVGLVGALLSKEHVGFMTAFLALPILFSSDLPLSRGWRRAAAAGTVVVSLGWSVVAFKWILPYFSGSGGGTTEIATRLRHFGSTPSEILTNVLTSPRAWLTFLGAADFKGNFKYVAIVLLPFVFYARHAWLWVLPALPGLAMNLISPARAQVSQDFHYELVFLPYLFFAFWWGLRREERAGRVNARRLALALLFALALSGRWPGRQLTANWPTWSSVRDSHFLSGLESAGPLAASWLPLGQVAHLAELRGLRFPGEAPPADPASAWVKLWALNSEIDMTRVPGHDAAHAKRWLLDLESPWEKIARVEGLRRGWREERVSPSGRFILLVK